MITVPAALIAAAALAVVYAALSDRLDYASVHRRLLDTWSAIGALACIVVIVVGGAGAAASTRRAAELALAQRPAPIARRLPVDLVTPIPAAVNAPGEPDGLWIAGAADSGDDGLELAVDGEMVGGPGDTVVDVENRSDGRSSGSEQAMAPVWDQPVGAEADDTPAVPPVLFQEGVYPTPSPRVVYIVTPTPTPTSRDVLPPPPTVGPTPDMRVAPTATPHCGSPERIAFHVRIADAEVRRDGDVLTVRYRARVESRSDFPITLANISVTAQNSASGSERYGHATLPDITLGPYESATLEGGVTLTKRPSPFGHTNLCIAMVGETCGLRPAYDVTRRCSSVAGY